MAISYKQAGVDIAAGDALVEWLKQQPPTSRRSTSVLSGIGGFAALFSARFDKKEPYLVTCTDGVGTKLQLAAHFGEYASVGQDLVAMNVNDLVCTGGEPLFFLDYYATGRLQLEQAKAFLSGVRYALQESDCLLLGGETAEMPGHYQGDDFDCAGFAVGVVDKSEILGPARVKSGDRLIGVASSGFHSNGFSLLRMVFSEDLEKWRDALLKPTALYVKLAKALQGQIHAMAHITGGGIDNILRVLPTGSKVSLSPWPVPEEFKEVQRRSGLAWAELLRVLNCGIGLVLIVEAREAQKLKGTVQSHGFQAHDLGSVEIQGNAPPCFADINFAAWGE